jgi:hypothetical protein
MSFFKKLGNNANNFFQKLKNDGNNIFKKVSDNVNNFSNNIVSKGIEIGQKAGNYLEKYSKPISDGVAGIASSFGLPELAPAIMGLGERASVLGRQLKNTSNQAFDRHTNIKNKVADIRGNLGNAPRIMQ